MEIKGGKIKNPNFNKYYSSLSEANEAIDNWIHECMKEKVESDADMLHELMMRQASVYQPDSVKKERKSKMKREIMTRDFTCENDNGIREIQYIIGRFLNMAEDINAICPDGPENSSRHKQMALTKLLESRDAAERAIRQYMKEKQNG